MPVSQGSLAGRSEPDAAPAERCMLAPPPTPLHSTPLKPEANGRATLASVGVRSVSTHVHGSVRTKPELARVEVVPPTSFQTNMRNPNIVLRNKFEFLQSFLDAIK